ncbi:hypothetical protein PHLGIDRAFT_448049 [Phlebiopsis gigantea 11061_1 CR5-6]|uniref:GST N-terminal domain-containing protein n=1 Tax=Phlebiopsis gigantea (strain 11061_1 CR5-6) TaxID=745531 RepID=A0A0C3NNK4_PHLG1|nr:hypothetical protein PHLGIDRAFT_448049 [Phlebiopsis gigantea 11061_1 CR5-6]
MSSELIVLYDIPGREKQWMSWSPNTLKPRMTLNYKGLQYRTEWVEYPDIEGVCKKIGARPTDKKADGSDRYTLPVLYDPRTQRVVSDSWDIARYLDDAYPDTPRVVPAGSAALQKAWHMLVLPTVLVPLLHIQLPHVCNILPPRSAEYFRRTREDAFGKKLEEVHSESDWEKLEQGLGKVKTCLEENGEGKDMLVMGDQITHADFVLVGIFIWARKSMGEDSDAWKRLSALHDGKWLKYVGQFAKYEYVDV